MADTKISALTEATNLTDADIVPIVQSGANKKAPMSLFTAPAFIRGSLDITSPSSPVGAVTEGALADSTARTANGVLIKAAFDYADSNAKHIEIPPGRYEYIVEGVDTTRNVGLQLLSGVRSLITGGSSESHGTRLVQYATNHPVLTLGTLASGEGALLADFLMDGGICLGHGVSQVGQTSADGLLIGGMWSSDLVGTIHVSPFLVGEFHPYCAMRVGLSSSNHVFFSNQIGKVQLRGGQANLLVHQSGGTGNIWNQIYAGGGGYDNRMTLTNTPIIFRSSGSDIGVIGQLNIEWTAGTSANCGLLLENIDGFFINSLHLEGMKVSASFDARVVSLESAFGQIGTMKALDVWIDTATVTGTPAFFSAYGSCDLKVGQCKLIWNGSGYNATTVADAPFRLYREATDSSVTGRHPFVDIGHLKVEGHEATFSLDSLTPAATYGDVNRVGHYTYTPEISTTDRARITLPSGNGAVTIYGVHRNAQVRQNTALTANRTVTLSDYLKASGDGSTSVRKAGDIVQVFRSSAATGEFDLIIKNSDGDTLGTFSGSASADTVQSFEWTGRGWAGFEPVEGGEDTTVDSNVQTGSYTLVLSDAGKAVRMNVASANNLTIPANSSVAFPVDTVIIAQQYGAGTTTIVPDSGVTVRSRGSLLDLNGQYAIASLQKIGTDEWIVAGDLA